MIITELQEKLIETKRGPAKKFVVKTDDGKTFDSFVNEWNKDWSVGQALSIEPEQWTSREYNGKMYYSVGAPKRSFGNYQNHQQAAPVAQAQMNESGTDAMLVLIEKLTREVRSNHEQVMREFDSLKQAKEDEIPF